MVYKFCFEETLNRFPIKSYDLYEADFPGSDSKFGAVLNFSLDASHSTELTLLPLLPVEEAEDIILYGSPYRLDPSHIRRFHKSDIRACGASIKEHADIIKQSLVTHFDLRAALEDPLEQQLQTTLESLRRPAALILTAG